MKWAWPAIGSNVFACVQLESRSSPISQSGVLVVLSFPTKCSWSYAHIAAQLQGKIITIECGTSSSRSSSFIRQQSIADERVCLCFIGVCVLIWTVQCVYCHRLINGNRACFCVIGRLRSSVFFRRFFFHFAVISNTGSYECGLKFCAQLNECQQPEALPPFVVRPFSCCRSLEPNFELIDVVLRSERSDWLWPSSDAGCTSMNFDPSRGNRK